MTTDPAQTVRRYLAAFADRDPDAIAAHVSPGLVNAHASELGEGCEGRDEYLSRLPGFLDAFADLRYDIEQMIVQGTAVAVAYRMTATSAGHPIDMRGALVLDVVDGLIARRTDYWDSLTYLRQIGASPT